MYDALSDVNNNNKNNNNFNTFPTVLLPLQGISVASVALFGSLDTTEPAVAAITEQMADTLSLGGQSTEGSTYAPPIRQGPGGNSSLVLG